MPVTGNGGVPTTASGVVANVTVTNTTARSYLTVYPATSARPLASDLNWSPGTTVPNLVVAELGTNGALGIYDAQGSTDVIVDVAGLVHALRGRCHSRREARHADAGQADGNAR